MSLEQTIAANTEAVAAQTSAINTLIALLQNSANTVQSVKATEGTTTSSVLANDKTDEPDAPKKTSKAKATPKADKTPEPDTTTTTAAEEGALTLAEVTPVVVELAKKDRAKAVALLGEYGAKKATELKPEQYAEFVKKAKALISGEAVEEAEDDLV